MDAIERIGKAITDGEKEATTGIAKVVGPIIRGIKFLVDAEIERLHRQIAFRDAFIEDRGETEYLHSWVWEGWKKEDYERKED